MGYFLRVYSKRPVHTLATILILGCGIAVTTFTFTLLNSILLEPLPYPESERIVRLRANVPPPYHDFLISTPTFDDIREQSKVFSSLCAIRPGTVNVRIGEKAVMARESKVTRDFFRVYNVYPREGTVFQKDGEKGIILSHHFWIKEFGGDPDVVGRSITIDGIAETVVGIMPEAFKNFYPQPAKDFISSYDIHTDYMGFPFWQDRRALLTLAVGKLKKGITLEQAQAEMDVIAARLHQETKAEMEYVGVRLVPLKNEVIRNLGHILQFSMAGAIVLFTIVLLLAGNLLISGWVSRLKEFGARLALGASRWTLMKQLLTESLLLSTLGGVLGLGLSVWLTSLFKYWSPTDIRRIEDLTTSEAVLGFWVIATVLGGLLPGLIAAATSSRMDPYPVLKGSPGAGSGLPVTRRSSAAITVLTVLLSCLLAIRRSLELEEISTSLKEE